MFEMSSYLVTIGPDQLILTSHESTLLAAILHAQWAMAHCCIYVSYATVALGLTLSWFSTSAETKLVSNSHHVWFLQKLWSLKNWQRYCKNKTVTFYSTEKWLKLQSRFYVVMQFTKRVRWVIYAPPFCNFPRVYVCQKLWKSIDINQSYERRRSGPFWLRQCS